MESKFKLTLNKFGKFEHKTINLSEVSILYGSNEVGKTTLIDAISHALAVYTKKQALFTSILKPRYGEEFDAKFKKIDDGQEADFKKIDHDLVKNLLIVRASNLDLEFSPNWVETVRNNLFAGGVDPSSIINAITLMEVEKTQKVFSPIFESNKIQKEIIKKQIELNDLKNQILSSTSSIKHQKDIEQKKITFTDQLEAITKKINHQQKIKEQAKKILEKKQISLIQSKIEQKIRLLEFFEEGSEFNAEGLKKIKDKEGEIISLQHEIQAEEKLHSQLKNDILKINEDLKSLLDDYNKLESTHLIASRTKDKLFDSASLKVKTRNKSNKFLMAIGIFFVLIGASLRTFIHDLPIVFSFSLIALGLILALKEAFFKPRVENDVSDLKNIVRKFNLEYDRSPACPDSDFQEAVIFLDKLIKSFTDIKSKKENLEGDFLQIQGKISDKELGISNFKRQLDSLGKELRDLYPNGISKSDDYFTKLKDFEKNQEKLKEVEGEIKSHIHFFQFANQDQLEEYVKHRIIEFNNINLPNLDISSNDLKSIEDAYDELVLERERINRDLSSIDKDLAVKNNSLQLTIGTFAKKQLEIEKEIKDLTHLKDKEDLRMESLKLFKSIVSEISSDMSSKFAILSDGINKYLEVILDNKRKITIKSLDNVQNIKCTDFYGKDINALQLSSGTRDAFVLSSRLALLEKIGINDKGLLILDDPFVLMDAERQSRAIQAIKSYYEDNKTPLLFFTKDAALKDELCKLFPEASLIKLERV
jgi:DNA repair exonuclease SbcCD ATPase subunit